MLRVWIALAVGCTLWVAARTANGQRCYCSACCQTYQTYYYGHMRTYPSVDQHGFPISPSSRSTYVPYQRSNCASGEYWERQYGPFGPRGFDW